jgi:hypothetical protein
VAPGTWHDQWKVDTKIREVGSLVLQTHGQRQRRTVHDWFVVNALAEGESSRGGWTISGPSHARPFIVRIDISEINEDALRRRVLSCALSIFLASSIKPRSRPIGGI